MNDTAIFLYDGDCAFCARCVSLLQRHLNAPARIIAWQTLDVTALGLTKADCAAAVQWAYTGKVHAGPAAFASLLRSTTRTRDLGWRLMGRLLATPPVLAAAWPVYRLVARHRHRLPGGASSCALPTRTSRDPLTSRPAPQAAEVARHRPKSHDSRDSWINGRRPDAAPRTAY